MAGKHRRLSVRRAIRPMTWSVGARRALLLLGPLALPAWIGVVLLAGAGAADMVSSVLRGLIVQLTTPEELRGRISSVNAMFVIGGPMLGQFESGVVAGVLTPELSVVTGGLACILATLAIAWKVPSVLRTKVK